VREQQRFTAGAHQLLAPLPFVLGGQVLAKPAAVKGAAVAATPAATGLFAQAGAAKALAATVALLATGIGVDAFDHEPKVEISRSTSPPDGTCCSASSAM
jgi:hypothetical protein